VESGKECKEKKQKALDSKKTNPGKGDIVLGNISRIISLLDSRLFNYLDNILSVIPFTSFPICLKRLGLSDSEKRIHNFHFPAKTSRASRIESIVFGQPPFDGIFFDIYHVTFKLDSAFQQESTIKQKANICISDSINQWHESSG
jgi:hypothetical protein